MSAPAPAPATPARLSVAEFARDVADELFHADRGLPYTVAMLTLRPQLLLRRWLEQRDPRCTRPFRYFLIVGALAVVAFVDGAREGAPGAIEILRLFGAAGNPREFGYAAGFLSGRLWGESPQWTLLLLTPFLAAWLSLLHGAARLNLAEAWACSLYAVGHALLFGSVLALLARLGLPLPVAPAVILVASLAWVWIASGAVRADASERLIPALLAAPLALTTLLALIVGLGVLLGSYL
jgi:hypothetical protein